MSSFGTGGARRARVLGFAGFRRSVADLARAVAFHRDGLGFVVESIAAESARLRLGDQRIELVVSNQVQPRGAPGTIDTGFQHLAIVASDLAAAHARLMRSAPVALTRGGPVRLPAAAGGVGAFKFLDPDGHPLELIHFPPGQGAAGWQRRAPSDGPTLGIDHSAIVVADAERSVAYYREVLGFTVEARQCNRGPAQDRLDGLLDVAVDVVALRPAHSPTPHLELLGYRTPAARAVVPPADGDVLCWWVDDERSGSRGARAAVEGGVELRDPDGHRHRLLPRPAGPAGA